MTSAIFPGQGQYKDPDHGNSSEESMNTEPSPYVPGASEWQPIETAPHEVPVWLLSEDIGIWIGELGYDGESWLWGNCYFSVSYAGGEWTAHDSETDDDYRLTHWMPLPAPPGAAASPALPQVDGADKRETFEKWYEGSALLEHSNWFRRDADGDYEIDHVDTSWSAWQAGAALATPPQAPQQAAPSVALMRDWLEAMEEAHGYVNEALLDATRMYDGRPLLQHRIDRQRDELDKHNAAIASLRAEIARQAGEGS